MRKEKLDDLELSLPAVVNNLTGLFALYEVVPNEKSEIDARLLWCNQGLLNVLSTTLENLTGRFFSDFAPNDLVWLPYIVDVAQGKLDHYSAEPYSAEANIYMHTEIYCPKPGYAVVLHVDRKQFIQSEAEQEQREKKVSAVFQYMPSGFCLFELIYDEQGNPVDISFDILNIHFEIAGGFRSNSLQGKRLLEEYPDYERQSFFEKFDQAIKTQERITFIMQQPRSQLTHEVICYPQGGNRLLSITNDVTERVKVSQELEQTYATIAEQNEMILESINYAKNIQKNTLPTKEVFEQGFSDYSIIWKPRDIVGGDIYWAHNFEQGTVLCVCDCTGHGMPGALLTMLVASAFDDYVNESNCSDTAGILWALNQKLVSVFSREQGMENLKNKDGCDLAAMFIAKDGTVTLSSAHMHVYVCDGKEVTQLKGQHIFIGEGSLQSKDDIKVIEIPANPDKKFYIASDGLSDQPGGQAGRPYGYREFKRIMLENHGEAQSVISGKVWDAFEAWRGEEGRVDDFELISFKA